MSILILRGFLSCLITSFFLGETTTCFFGIFPVSSISTLEVFGIFGLNEKLYLWIIFAPTGKLSTVGKSLDTFLITFILWLKSEVKVFLAFGSLLYTILILFFLWITSVFLTFNTYSFLGCFPVSSIVILEILWLNSGSWGIEDKGLFLSSFPFVLFAKVLFPLKAGVDFWAVKLLWFVVVVVNLLAPGLFPSLILEVDWLVVTCFLSPPPALKLSFLVVEVVVVFVVIWLVFPWLGWFLKFVVVVVVFVVVVVDEVLLAEAPGVDWFFRVVLVVVVVVLPCLPWLFWPLWFVAVEVEVFDLVTSSLDCVFLDEAPPSFVVVVVVLTVSFFPEAFPCVFVVVVVVVVVSVVLIFFPCELCPPFLDSFFPPPICCLLIDNFPADTASLPTPSIFIFFIFVTPEADDSPPAPPPFWDFVSFLKDITSSPPISIELLEVPKLFAFFIYFLLTDDILSFIFKFLYIIFYY